MAIKKIKKKQWDKGREIKRKKEKTKKKKKKLRKWKQKIHTGLIPISSYNSGCVRGNSTAS